VRTAGDVKFIPWDWEPRGITEKKVIFDEEKLRSVVYFVRIDGAEFEIHKRCFRGEEWGWSVNILKRGSLVVKISADSDYNVMTLKSLYNKDFVEKIKELPKKEREWDPSLKEWYFPNKEEVFLHIINAVYSCF